METQEKQPDGAGSTVQLTSPEAEKKSPAFHLFLYLISYLSLGFVIWGVIGIYFQLVNKYYPDLDSLYRYGSTQANQEFLKFAISSLFVAIPVYFGVVFFINRKLQKQDIPAGSLIRKFVTYLALFIFSAMSIGSLVSLVYNYLDGELTSRAMIKILVFFIVSAFYFVFYFWEIRRSNFQEKEFAKTLSVSLALAVSALVVGFTIVDSPTVARQKREDAELVSSMQGSIYNIESFYRDEKRLPSQEDHEITLDKGITYIPSDGPEYQMCGNFKQPAEKQYVSDNWSHPAGEHCFRLDATAAGGTGPINSVE